MNMVNNWDVDVDDVMRFAWKLWAIVSNVSITWIDSKRCEVHRYVAVQKSRPCRNVHPQNRQTEVQMFGIHRLWDWALNSSVRIYVKYFPWHPLR